MEQDTRPCARCGVGSRANRTYCRECIRALGRESYRRIGRHPGAPTNCARCGDPRGVSPYESYCQPCGATRQRERQKAQPTKTGATDEPRPCSFCGVAYRPKHRKTSIYCSRQCKERAKAPRLVARRCSHCGTEFMPKRNRTARTCSKVCIRAAHRLQSSLRSRAGEPVRPGIWRVEIAERDGWRCGICRRRVDPSLRFPHPMQGTLDHVVPVTEGGDSDPANLRLAHMDCNRRRGNRGGNEQLALLG